MNRDREQGVRLRKPLPVINLLQAAGSTPKSLAVTLAVGAAGTTGSFNLTYKPVLNADYNQIAKFGDTSLVVSVGTALATEVPFGVVANRAGAAASLPSPDIGDFDNRVDYSAYLANGEYYVVYEIGKIYYKKFDNTVDVTMTWYIQMMEVAIGGGVGNDMDLIAVGGVAITLGQKTSAASIPVVLPSDAAANSGSASSGDATYMSPRDFTATYASGTTLTLAGLSFTPTTGEFMSVKRQDTTGVSVTYTPDVKAFSYNSGTGVLTVTDAAFTATDVFVVTVIGPQKKFSASTDSGRNEEISPMNQMAVQESWVDTTNVGAGPTYYPSSDGKEMTGIKSISFTGKLVEADAENNTFTFEGTNDEDATSSNRDWITLYATRIDTDTRVASVVCNAATVTFGLQLIDANYKYIRAKFIGGASATNTVILKARTVAL